MTANEIMCMVKDEIMDCYKDNYVKAKDLSDDPRDTIIHFFSWLYRQIPAGKKQVYFSSELTEKMKDLDDNTLRSIQLFKQRFEDGEDMTGFLSRQIFEADRLDYLRFVWRIYHLHLSEKVALSKTAMKKNRSDKLLLAMIKPSEVYFIDIINHPEKPEGFFDIQHLKIIINNGWMSVAGFAVMENVYPGSLKPKITDAEHIFKLYSCHVNLQFEFDEIPYFNSNCIIGSGTPFVATEACNTIVDKAWYVAQNGYTCDSVKFMSDPDNRLMLVAKLKKDGKDAGWTDLMNKTRDIIRLTM